MHAVFMLHGKKELVDRAIMWLQTRLVYLRFENPNKKDFLKDSEGKIVEKGAVQIDAVLRYGLFGTWELVFPEGHKDEILTTLGFHKTAYGGKYGWKIKTRLLALRRALGLKKAPKFDTSKQLTLPTDLFDNISIIPIGVRYDQVGEVGGVIHERL